MIRSRQAPLALFVTQSVGDVSVTDDQSKLSFSNQGSWVGGTESFEPIVFRVSGVDEAGRFSGWSDEVTANPPPPGCSATHLSKNTPNVALGFVFVLGAFAFRRRRGC